MSSARYGPQNLSTTSVTLIERLQHRVPEAFGDFLRLYGPVVRYWVRQERLSGADADDVFQEVFLAAARGIQKFARMSGNARFRGWLKSITHHRCVDFFRKRTEEPIGDDEACNIASRTQPNATEGESDEWSVDERTMLARRAVDLVRPTFREHVWACFWRTEIDGLDATAVAEELGMQPAAVRKNKARVLQRLRATLADAGLD